MKKLLFPISAVIGMASFAGAIEAPNGEANPAPAAPQEAPAQPVEEKKAYLGVYTQEVPDILLHHNPDLKGAFIGSVLRSGAAADAGLQEFDILSKVGEHAVDSPESLRKAMSNYQAGQQVPVQFHRGGKVETLEIEMGVRPERPQFAGGGPRMRIMPFNQGGGEMPQNLLGDEDMQRLQQMLQQQMKDIDIPGLPEGMEFKGARKFEFNVEQLKGLGNGYARGMKMGPNGRLEFEQKRTPDGGKVTKEWDKNGASIQLHDAAGELLFEGPFNNADDADALPEDFRKSVEDSGFLPGKS